VISGPTATAAAFPWWKHPSSAYPAPTFISSPLGRPVKGDWTPHPASQDPLSGLIRNAAHTDGPASGHKQPLPNSLTVFISFFCASRGIIFFAFLSPATAVLKLSSLNWAPPAWRAWSGARPLALHAAAGVQQRHDRPWPNGS